MKVYRAKNPPLTAYWPTPVLHWTHGEEKAVHGEHGDPPSWLEPVFEAPKKSKRKGKPEAASDEE